MKRTTMALPLLLCCCASGLQHIGTSGPYRPVAGIVDTLATCGADFAAGSIWLDRYANIYCTDRAKQRMVSYRYPSEPAGESVAFRFEQPLDDPGSFLVPGYNDGYCLADNIGHRLVFYSYQGRQTGALSIAGRVATAAAIDAAGDIYVLDGGNRSVQVYDQRGAPIRLFMLAREQAAPEFRPAGMAVAQSAQQVVVADPAAGIVQCYNALGRYGGSFPLRASSLAFDRSDRLWSVDSGGRISVQVWRRTGWQILWQGQQELPGSASAIAAGPGDAVVIAAGNKLISCR